MGWLYVPGLRVSNSDSSSPSEIPIAPSVTWKGRPLRLSYWPAVWKKAVSKWRLSGTISNPSTEVRPRIVVLENVPGLLVRGFGDVLGELAALGFDAEWLCLRASEFGAPHVRRRVFVLAWRERDALRLLTERGEGSTRPTEPRDAELGHVGEALADSSSGGRGELRQSSRQAGFTKRDGEDLADAAGARRPPGQREARHASQSARRAEEPDGRDPSLADAERAEWKRARDRSEALADSDSGDTKGTSRPGSSQSAGAHDQSSGSGSFGLWPPGPDEDWGGIEESAQPAIRRVAHGLPFRLDRIAALGNGVVPVVAAKAFLALAERALR